MPSQLLAAATPPARARGAVCAATLMVFLTAGFADAQDGQPPPDVRSVIEGTWELVEWHVGDQVLRSPQMEGRWMVHDGLVMATRHRVGPTDFESTAGYGAYRWGPTSWTYGYERSEDLRGPSPENVDLRVTGSNPIQMRTFEITRDGHMIVLVGDALRWEYDVADRTFVLKRTTGETIRKYRKVD